jgi:hypothetical protein
MRPLLCLCLATGLLAGETPQPGRDPAFLARVLGGTDGGSRPWKAFRVPEDSASAVVEVVGEYSREELRQVAFQEFQVWFREDLHRFWLKHGFMGPAADGPPPARPATQSSGSPGPQMLPLGKIGF